MNQEHLINKMVTYLALRGGQFLYWSELITHLELTFNITAGEDFHTDPVKIAAQKAMNEGYIMFKGLNFRFETSLTEED